MFQTFETRSDKAAGPARLALLRAAMAEMEIDGFLVPRADEFQGEYVPACAERLAWLTGFTGSAGVALVTMTEAIVFVDGRYTTQAAEQMDLSAFAVGDLVGKPVHKWLAEHAPSGFRLGLDPWLHTAAERTKLDTALFARSGHVVLVADNPLDRVWADRPAPPAGRVRIHDLAQAGELATAKIARLAEAVGKAGAGAVVLTDPSSVAWAFNLRGSDVPHTPHPLARAIIHADGRAEIFLAEAKTTIEERAYLAQFSTLGDPATLADRLALMVADDIAVALDPDLAPLAVAETIRAAGGRVVDMDDPVKLPRATKNATELAGMAAAHRQDGAAMVRFLCWLDSRPAGTVSEIEAVTALEAARAEQGRLSQNPLLDISFDTISGAGENAAIIHYRVSEATNRMLKPGEMFLLDSGGQYINGTTDITRTVAIGDVPEEQKRFFTLVLKGMIAISTARFPKGTRGLDLDPLARIALWKAGADYGHGTGHGVGSYLSVHEGPQRISRLATQELFAGMVLSNEPGYYRPGAFGIRIENLVHVAPAADIEGGDKPMLGFETLTWCPIDRRLILPHLLTREEVDWLDAYHARTRAELSGLIDDVDTRAWLEAATAPL